MRKEERTEETRILDTSYNIMMYMILLPHLVLCGDVYVVCACPSTYTDRLR